MAISLLVYAATFSGQLCLWRNYICALLKSNYFDTTVTFFEVAIIRLPAFSRQLYSFARATFSEDAGFFKTANFQQLTSFS